MTIQADPIFIPILLVLSWWLFTQCYRQYRVDLLRQRLFEIRDKMFRKAADDKALRFNDEAYKLFRLTINGMIRYGHDITFVQLLFITAFKTKLNVGYISKQYERSIENVLKEIPKSGQEVIKDAFVRMHMVVLAHIVHTSIVLITIWFVVVRPLMSLVRGVNAMKLIANKLSAQMYTIDAEANRIGRTLNLGNR